MSVELHIGQMLVSTRHDGSKIRSEIVGFLQNGYSDIFAITTRVFLDEVLSIAVYENNEPVEFKLEGFDPDAVEISNRLRNNELGIFQVGVSCLISASLAEANPFELCKPSNISFWRELYIARSDDSDARAQNFGVVVALDSQVLLANVSGGGFRSAGLVEIEMSKNNLADAIGRLVYCANGMLVGIVIATDGTTAYLNNKIDYFDESKLSLPDTQSIEEHNRVAHSLNLHVQTNFDWEFDEQPHSQPLLKDPVQLEILNKRGQEFLTCILQERPYLFALESDPIALLVEWTIITSNLKNNGATHFIGEFEQAVFSTNHDGRSSFYFGLVNGHSVKEIIQKTQSSAPNELVTIDHISRSLMEINSA